MPQLLATLCIVFAKPQRGTSSMDIGVAVENLLIAAHGQGLGTCCPSETYPKQFLPRLC